MKFRILLLPLLFVGLIGFGCQEEGDYAGSEPMTQETEVDFETAMDAVRALGISIREERVIVGEPSDRTAVSVEETIRREYDRWMVVKEGDDDKDSEAG